jgi:hypothetical protein
MVVVHSDIKEMEKQVNDALQKGFNLAGMMFEADGKFYQPLSKETADKALAIKKQK